MKTLLFIFILCPSILLLPTLEAQTSPDAGSAGAVTRVVPSTGAFYHYHWQYPHLGFRNPDGSDALTQHFPKPEEVDFASLSWHRRQLEMMMETELNFFLPAYGCTPQQVSKIDATPAHVGLERLVQAMKEIVKAQGQPPRIAMYLQTESLLSPGPHLSARGSCEALLQKLLFAFFDAVPAAMRFEQSGFPVVVVASSQGVVHDIDLFNRLSDAFLARYKVRPWFITDSSWNCAATARWHPGAALYGPSTGSDVMTLGPGYDDTSVPSRGTPVRKREDTRFYQWSWNKALFANPTLVLIESWNDFTHGTGICDSQEYGRRYMDLTRRYIGRLRHHILPDLKHPVRLAHPEPIPRPDRGWWRIQNVRDRVFFVAAEHRNDFGYGLRLGRVADGAFKRTKTAGISTVTPWFESRTESYLYFGIADEFAHRTGGSFEVEVILHPASKGTMALHYDSWDRTAALRGAYKRTPSITMDGDSDQPGRFLFTLPDPRFGNRQNGGTDFRLVFRGSNMAVIGIQVRRLPEKILDTRKARVKRL